MLYSSHWLARRVALACIFVSSGAVALPKQAEIKQGLASIESDANTMTVLQESDRVSIDYQSFDIASHESVIFQQPNVNSVALNRVIGNDVSQIFGLLQSNGKVFLVNPNGILFGENARVDVGSLLATTKNISDDAFMMGNYQFSGEQQTAIVNKGLIEAANDGLIVFVADHINNEGELSAPQGHIELVSANDITLDIAGETVSIISNQAALDALIENHGLISTDGGMIVFNADAKEALEQTVVNNTGVVKATGVVEKNGEIFIVGNQGDVILDGEISANGFGDTDAGNIQIDANRVAVVGEINANGDQLSDGGNIDLRADSNIFLADGSRISADAGTEGDGGRVINFSPGTAFFASDSKLSAKGGAISGDGGFLEVSGLQKVDIFGQVDTSAVAGESGTFYIDPYDITISNAANANGAFDAGSPNSWEGSGVGTTSTINSAAITAALTGSDVIINTALDDGSGPGTGTGTINIDNDIDLNGGNGNTLSFVADDTITLAAGVKIEDKTPGSADAVTVNLTSSNNIIFNNDADIFTTGGNSTVISSNNLQLFGNASIQTGNGTISINANDVDLVGSLVSTSSSNTAISILSGQQIADSGAATIDIVAASGGVVLQAEDGISIDTNTTTISVTNGTSGNVNIDEADAISISDIDVVGNFSLTSTGGNDITLDQITSVNDLSLTTTGNIRFDTNTDFTASGAMLLDAANLFDDAGGASLDLTAGGTLTLPDTLNITTAALNLDGNDIVDVSGTRNLDITTSSLSFISDSAGGNVSLQSDVNFLSVNNQGANLIQVVENDALSLVAVLLSTGNVNISNLTGDITTTLGGISANAAGATLELTADNDLNINTNISSGGGANNLTFVATNGSINFADGVSVASGGGNVVMTATNAGEKVDIGLGATVNAGAGTVTITADQAELTGISTTSSSLTAVQVTSNTTITDGGTGTDISATSGRVVLNANTGITGDTFFDVQADSIDVTNSVSGDVLLAELNGTDIVDIDVAGGFFSTNQPGSNDITISNVTNLGGDIDISVSGVITIPDAGLDAGVNDLVLSGSDIVDVSGRDLILDGNDLYLDITSLGATTNFATSVDTLDANFAGTGNVVITNDKALQLVDSTHDANTDALIWSTDDLSIITTAGDLTQTDSIELDGLTSGETLALNAANDLLLNSTISDTVGGVDNDIRVDLDAGNVITMASTSFVDAGDGTSFGFIDLNATGDITLTGLKTLSTSGSAMNIVSTTGSILDAGNVNTDVDARNGRVQLTAATGIADIETHVNNIDLYNLVSGNIVINEQNNLGLFDLSSPGDVTLNAGTSISINTDIQLDGDNGATYTFNATNDINVNQNICEGGGTCASVDDAVNINLNSTAGSIYVATGQSILTGGGNANISATAAGQEFNMADTTALDVGAGKIVVTADDMRVTNLDSTNTDFDSIQLTSANRINERSGNDVNTAGGVIFNVGAGIYGTVAMVDTPFEVLASEVRVTNTGAGTPVLLNIGSTGTTYEIIDVAGDFFTETVNANSDFVFNDFTNLGGTVDIIATRDIDLNASLNGAAGDITLTASTGNLTLPDAGITTANDLNITANDIVDVSGRDLNLGANNLYLDITNLAGDTNFASSVNTLDANFSGTGNVVVSNDADIQLLDSAHDANSRSLTFDSGNVTVVSTGDINVSSDIDLDGANGTRLTLDAGTDLVFDMNVFVQDFATGSVDAVTIDFQAGSNFVLDEDSDIVSTGGDITIQATNAFQKLRRSQIDAGSGLIDIQGNSVELRGNTISTNTSASAIQVTSGTTIVDGLDGTGMTDLEATAGGVVLSAATGIEVDTDTTSLAVTNSTSGVVTIQEADAITVTDINAAGNFSLSSTGGNDITLDQITNVNDLTFTTTGNIRFDTNSSFAAVGDMTLDAANIINDAGGADLDLSSGGTLTLPDTVNVAGTSLNLTANDIADLSGRDLDITAAGVYLNVSNLAADTNFATSMNTLDANFGGTGNVVINNDMALQLVDTINDANAAALMMGAGTVTITSAGGSDLDVISAIDLDGANGSSLTLASANDLDINANICDGGVACSLTPDDVVNIVLSAGNDQTLDTNVNVHSGGGNIDLNAINIFRKRTGSDVNSGAGLIDIQGNDVNLLGITTSTSSSAQAIEVTSGTSILDGSNPTLDVVASAGGIVLNAATGINLDVDAAQLNISNSTSGDVIIDEENTVDITGLSFAGGDATITTLNAGNLSTSGTIDLDGANGQILNLIAANDLIFNAGGEIRDSVTGSADAVALNLTAGNDMTLATSSDLDSYGGNIVIGVTGDYTANAGADVRSDTGTINLSANDVTLIGSLRSNNTSANAITVTSLDSITDGGANNIDISASAGGVDLNAINGIDIDLDAANLDLTNATMGNVILEGTGNLDITNLAASALSNVSILKNNENGNSGGDVTLSGYANSGDLTITSDGTVTFPDSGLNAGANDLTIEANDIQDVSGRTLDFTVAQLSLDLANPANDLTLNTNVDNFQAHFGTAADLTVNESDALVLSDVAGLGSAIDLAGGNFILNSGALTVDSDVTVQQGDIQFITNGDAQINADITASDAVSDGLREGLIDIGVNNGSLTVGGTGPVSIISNNTADQTANGGVTSTLSDQVGISFKQLDTSNSSHTFTFGNGVGNDVLVQAIGGDVDIDSVNSVAAGAGAARPLIFNSDLTLESYNNASDPSSGAADLSGLIDNGATVNILSGRLARFNPSEIVVAPAPAPAPAPAEPPVEDIVSEIVDQVEDVNDPTQDPLETEDPVIAKQVESDSTQVSNTFQRAFGSCSEAERANNSGNCKVDDVLVKFLSAFVIGGALPKVGN